MRYLMLVLLLAGWNAHAQTEKTMTFSEELRLGPNNDAELGVWKGSWVSVAVAKSGHILVVEPSRNRIIHFDQNGTLIGPIDGSFEGNEAFKNLRSLSILDNQTAIAHDQQAGVDVLTIFDADMKPVERKSLPKKLPFILSAIWAPDGNSLAAYYYMPDKPGRNNVYSSVLNKERGLGRVIAGFNAPPLIDGKATSPEWWAEFLAPFLTYIHEGQGLIRYGADNCVYTAKSNEYQIECLRPGSNLPLVFAGRAPVETPTQAAAPAFIEQFKQDLQSIFADKFHSAITTDAIQRAMTASGLTMADFAIHDMVPLEDGQLLVVTQNDWAGNLVADLLDNQGARIGQVKLPAVDVNGFASLFTCGVKLWFVGGKAYGIEVRDGEMYVVRYAYEIK